jgi:hypothetical protein
MIMSFWPGYMLRRAITKFLHTVSNTLHKSKRATFTRMPLKSEMRRKQTANGAVRLVMNHCVTGIGIG